MALQSVESYIKMMVDDIKHMEKAGFEPEEILQEMDGARTGYGSRRVTDEMLKEAFYRCGYEITF